MEAVGVKILQTRDRGRPWSVAELTLETVRAAPAQ
jgi:hypothetical protein